MEKLQTIINQLTPPDQAVMAAVQARLDNLTKPLGSLGTLEQMAKQYAGAKKVVRPALPRKALVVITANHRAAGETQSDVPAAQKVQQCLRGGAAINVLARHADAQLVLVDTGLNAQFVQHLPLTINCHSDRVLSRQAVLAAIHIGIDTVNDLLNADVDAIGIGVLGGEHYCRMITEAIAGSEMQREDPLNILAKVGSPEIAALTGAIIAAAAGRALIMLDDFVSSAAALAAWRLAPKVQPYLIAAHLSPATGHEGILQALALKPLLWLGMPAGGGCGAALGLTLLDAGIKILNEMATFDEAKVAYALQDLSK